MRRFTSGITLIVILISGGCSDEPPKRSAPAASVLVRGNPDELKTLKAQRRTAPKEAVAGLEAYVAKYPTDPSGHLQLAGAITEAMPVLPSYSDADRAALERAAHHERKVLELSTDRELRAAAYMKLTQIYGPLMLKRPEEVIEPAKQLIAMPELMPDPHLLLAEALADLKRVDEAVRVWSDAQETLRGRDRRHITTGVKLFADLHPELSHAHVQTLVTVLTTVAADVENPDPEAKAVALTLRAERLEKDVATQRALLQEAAPWKALAEQEHQKTFEEMKAALAELQRRSASKRE